MVAYDPVAIEQMAQSLTDDQRRMAGVIGRVFAAGGYGPSMQAAAVANAYMESLLNPKKWGDWRKSERRHCSGGLFQLNRCGGAGMGMTMTQIEDPLQNAQRMLNELEGHFGRPVVRAWISGERRVGELARLMCVHMLRPSNAAEKAQRRKNIAKALYPHLATGTMATENYGAAAWWGGEWIEGVPESKWSHDQHIEALELQFRALVIRVVKDLEAEGWDPIIVSSWRSQPSQQLLFVRDQTTKRFSFHNIETKSGFPSAMAVDIIDASHRYGTFIDPRTGVRMPHVEHRNHAIQFFRDLAESAKRHGLIAGGSKEQQMLRLDTSWETHGLSTDPSHLQMFSYDRLPEYQREAERVYEEKHPGVTPPWRTPYAQMMDMYDEEERRRQQLEEEHPRAGTTPATQTVMDLDGLPTIIPEGAPGWEEDAVSTRRSSSSGGGVLAMGLVGLGTALILLGRS